MSTKAPRGALKRGTGRSLTRDAGRVAEPMCDAGGPASPAGLEDGERFAAFLAHELRTPIATQRALLELAVADHKVDPAGWRGIAEDVLAACMQQERLLEACFTLARSRGSAPRREPLDLAAIAADALQDHDLTTVECFVELESAWTEGDQTLVERLAGNLVSNAIRHNVVGGRIELRTNIESGRAVLSIANSGPLVPAAELQRLFQPFQRLGLSPRSLSDGVGLGLAIVQAIADAHGAYVTPHARPSGGLRIEVAFLAHPGCARTRAASPTS